MGKLGQVLREEASVYIESMMKNISDNLVTCKRQKRERCSEAVTCLALLADADIKSVRPHIRSVLNQLFEGQLTAPFAHNIASICITFPELHSSCLDRILVLARRQLQSIPIRSSVSSNTVESQLLEQTFQSLRVLNFKGYSTLNFLSEEVVPRLWEPHQSVRRSAVELCLQLLLSGCYAPGSPCYMDASNVMIHSGARHISFISKIQQHLIAVAVSDSEVEIRLATLEMLVENFDHTLSMQESIRSIFPALNDKHANRVAAVRLLGRLSKRNPAAVFPMLRRIIIQCVTEIEYLTDARALRGSVDEKKLEHWPL